VVLRRLPRIHLLTFGGGSNRYRAAAHRVGKQAKASGMFASINVVDDPSLRRDHPEFVAAHADVLRPGVRGFGYWLWKPTLVAHALRDDDFLLYVDGGCILNLSREEPRRRLIEYTELAAGSGGLFMQMRLPEWQWSKRDTVDRLALADADRASGQLVAGMFLLRGSAAAGDLVRTWHAIAVEDGYHYLDDSPSHQPEHDGFVEHRHDQAILSGLAKTAGFSAIPDETYHAPDWATTGADLPVWATRHHWRYSTYGTRRERMLFRLDIRRQRWRDR